MIQTTRLASAALVLLAALAIAAPVFAADPDAIGFERTPPRLSFVDGDVSFFRPGAPDWTAAEVNIPLAAGDALYAAEDANVEVQIGPRGYLRAGAQTEVTLASLEPDFLQLRVDEGRVSLDLRTLIAGQTFEVDTPNAAFTIERSGYYRVEVSGDTTTFITRRGGRAVITPARGPTTTIAASEQVVVSGASAVQVESYAAPQLDAWDRWNYARTDAQLDAASARYVPAGVYGVDDLDHYGNWRVVPTYGAIWVPRGVAVGWAPYTTGRWIYDPFYGWTWVDTAPWGWAPYHYGRWVNVSGYWAWAPGPLVARPYYAPALVAFFGGGGVSVSISLGAPQVGWLALGWGEPIVPWWGPRGFRGVPRWAGWGGPRVVNRVVIDRKKTIGVREIREYQNQQVRNAFVAVDRDRFGGRDVVKHRVASVDEKRFERIEGALDLRPTRESLAASSRAGRRPPREWQDRAVVATRAPRPAVTPEFDAAPPRKGEERAARREQDRPVGLGKVRVVEPSSRSATRGTLERPPFGTRGESERAERPPAPRYRPGGDRAARDGAATPAPEAPRRERTHAPAAKPEQRERAATPAPSRRERSDAPAASTPAREAVPRASDARERTPDLPGEPANRVYRPRERTSRPDAAATPATRQPDVTDAGRGPRDGGKAGKRDKQRR